MPHVYNADAAQLHVVADKLRRAAHERILADAFYLDRVVGDESVAALDKLQRRLALTDAAVAHQQHALAVDLDEHAVRRYARSEIVVQGADDVGLKLRGVLRCHEHVPVEFLRHLKAFRKRLHPVAYHEAGDVVLHKALERGEALLMAQRVKICTLDPPHNLQAVRIEIVIKPRELHGRAVHVRRDYQSLLIISGGMQRGKLQLLGDGLEFYGIFAAHRLYPPFARGHVIYYYINQSRPFWQQLLHASGRKIFRGRVLTKKSRADLKFLLHLTLSSGII